MAYDIVIARRLPGEDWDRTLERIEQSADMTPPRLSETMTASWRRAADRIGGGDLEPGRVNQMEMSLRAPDVRIVLEEHSAYVAVPHAHGARDATAAMSRVAGIVTILCEESGWSAYDQQLGRELSLPDDLTGEGARVLASRAGTLDDDTAPEPRWKFWRRSGR